MPTIEETINTLKDMGFSEAQAKKALNKTGWSGIEAAAEWLLSNPGDDGTEEAAEESTTATVRTIFTYIWIYIGKPLCFIRNIVILRETLNIQLNYFSPG